MIVLFLNDCITDVLLVQNYQPERLFKGPKSLVLNKIFTKYVLETTIYSPNLAKKLSITTQKFRIHTHSEPCTKAITVSLKLAF